MSTADLSIHSKEDLHFLPSIHPILTEPSTPALTAEDVFKFSPSEIPDELETTAAYLSAPLNDTDLLSPTVDLNADNLEAYEHVAWGLDALINEAVIKSGYLLKKGEKRKTWKKRWFVLKSTKLAYYESDKEYELLHYIDLDTISTAALITSKKQCFGLVTKSRTYYIQAENEEVMLDWVWEIQNALKQRKANLETDLQCSHTSAQLGAKMRNRLSVPMSKDNAALPAQNSTLSNAFSNPIDIVLTPSTPYGYAKTPLSVRIEPDSPHSDPVLPFFTSFRSPSSTNMRLATAAFVKNNSTALSGSFTTVAVPQSSAVQPILIKRQSQNIIAQPLAAISPHHLSLPISIDPERRSISSQFIITSQLGSNPQSQVNSQTFISSPAQPPMPSSLPVQSALKDLSTPVKEYTPKNVKFEGVAASVDILAFQKCDFGDEFSSEEDMNDELMSSQGSGLVIRSRVLHQGYLEKQRSSLSKGWSVRWFVLRNNRLVCYKDDKVPDFQLQSNPKEYETRRVIEMRDVLDVIEVDSLGKGKNFCFKVVLHKKSLFLCADSQDVAQEWISMLKKVHEEVGQKIALN